GTPRHFHSSVTFGSACLIRERFRESVSPRQSPSSLILASINRDGDSPLCEVSFFFIGKVSDDSSRYLCSDPNVRENRSRDMRFTLPQVFRLLSVRAHGAQCSPHAECAGARFRSAAVALQ